MKFKIQIVFILFLPLIAFAQVNTTYTLKVLGVVQDGGLPHLGSNKLCCDETQSKRHVTSLMLINNRNNYSYLFDASPDINEQLNFMGDRIKKDLKGIFLTHAHIGHYTGLMYFGREALNSKSINVYAMPRMKKFLEQNGPWSQLVSLENILINESNEIPTDIKFERVNALIVCLKEISSEKEINFLKKNKSELKQYLLSSNIAGDLILKIDNILQSIKNSIHLMPVVIRPIIFSLSEEIKKRSHQFAHAN